MDICFMKLFGRRGSRVSTINDWLQIKIGGEDEIVKKKKGEKHPNRIKSTKYSLITFLPQNLLEQFRRIANFYFLVMTVISLVIDSPVSPMTSLLPLVFVISVTAAKQGYEDFLRYKTDNIVNRSAVTVLRKGQEMHIESQDVAPGDLVVVERDCDVPCDLVLLRSTDPHGKCFITTANLDGESNLKTLMVPRDLPIVEPNKLHKLGFIECESPKTDLYSFNGKIELAGNEGRILPLTADNVLLRGSRVKNTQCVIGCAVYLGMTTKLQLNSRLTRNKTASSEDYINRFLIFVLVSMIAMVTLMYFLKRYDELYVVPYIVYLGPPVDGYSIKQFLQDYLSFLILFNYLIPISLYVTIEVTRVFGGLFMEWDVQMYDEVTNEHCIVNTSNLNEELGQINILFSDKTGTLTKNEMIFQQCSIGGRKFIYKKTRLLEYGSQKLLDINKFNNEQKSFFQALAICHTVQVAKYENESEGEEEHTEAKSDKNTTPVGLAKMYSISDIAEESRTSSQQSEINVDNTTALDISTISTDPNGSAKKLNETIKRRSPGYKNADARIPTVNEDEVDSEAEERKSTELPKVTRYVQQVSVVTNALNTNTIKDVNPLLNEPTQSGIQIVRSSSNNIRSAAIFTTISQDESLSNSNSKKVRLRPTSLQFRRTHSDVELADMSNSSNQSLGHRRSQSYGAPIVNRKNSGNSDSNVVYRSNSLRTQESIIGLRESYAAPSFQRQPTILIRAESTRRKHQIAETVQMLDYQASSPDEKALVEASANLGLVYLGDDDEVLKIRVIPPHLDSSRPFRPGKNVELSFERLHVLEFSSDRKRMSVIVRDENGEKWIYTKGAESYVFPLCSQNANRMITLTNAHITDFAQQGLRTLAVARRKVNDMEYQNFVKCLNEANSSLENRNELSAKCYASIESELTLLGATAVEDALQDNVSDTLVSLQGAGIKIWVLTGDKVETALNIALACGHIPQNALKYFIIDCTNKDDMILHLNALDREIIFGLDQATALLIDGPSLSIALNQTPIEFRNVSVKCTAVLCCRLSPLQKSEVVSLIKTAPNNYNTAAIGDGANDVSMIQEAHVGIGIMGKEGRQAARCADFAFAKFSMLKRLILVHGHYHTTRLSFLVLYFFYKNIVFMGIMFLFQFYTLYSSVSVYDSLFLTLYNVIYTSVPILFISYTEKPFTEETLMRKPELYQRNVNNKQLQWPYFLGWTLNGIFHSLICFYFAYLVFSTNDVILNGGQTAAFSCYGTLLMQMVCIVVNLKLLIESKYLSYWYIGIVICSILAFVVTTVIYNVINFQYDTDIYWAYNKLLSSIPVWLCVLVTTIACLVPDFTISVAFAGLHLPKRSFFPGNESIRRLKMGRNKVQSTYL